MLDVFKGDAFGIVRLTDAINKMPFVPSRVGRMGLFDETGIDTLYVDIEEKEGRLYLVPNKARGAPPTQNQKADRRMRTLKVHHLPVSDALYADEIQGVRAFGSEDAMETIGTKVNEKMLAMGQSIEATIEYHRLGAIKGTILDADGSTTLYNLFTEFGITATADVNFDFGHNVTSQGFGSGELRQKCAGVVRTMADSLGAASILGVHALCGNEFFDRLLKEAEVRESYTGGGGMAQILREPYVYPNGLAIYGAFEFGGIVWENYRGSVGSVTFVDPEEAHMFPIGVPGLFRCVYGPAPYIETVNTIGRPIYAKITPDPKNTHIDIDVQSNPLCYCTRPSVLIKGVQGGS
jgi:hypothetical protein